jgi:AraC-like DNA-binding protein
MAVQSLLEKMQLPVISINLGEVVLGKELSIEEKGTLEKNLTTLGFELLNDKNSQLIEKIKNLIIDLVHYNGDKLKINLSDYLVSELHQDYSALSKLFSEIEGKTIEHYFINQKIEKVKELLVYNELTLSEIAIQLNYSSVAHLSNQFKKNTGLTPTQFKVLKDKKRKEIDDM